MFNERNPFRTMLSAVIMTIVLTSFEFGGSHQSAMALQVEGKTDQDEIAKMESLPRTKNDLKTLSDFFRKLQQINGKLIALMSQAQNPKTGLESGKLEQLWTQAKSVYLPGISSSCARVSAERSLEELRQNILLIRSIAQMSGSGEAVEAIFPLSGAIPIYQMTEERFISENNHMFQSYGCLGYPKSGINPQTWSLAVPMTLSSATPGPVKNPSE